jgi:hypothetical protein
VVTPLPAAAVAQLGEATTDLDVRRLEVVERDEHAAVVAVAAELRHTLEHPVHGPIERELEIRGRIELELVDGEWRVVDYERGGRRLTEVTLVPTGTVGPETLRVEVAVLTLGGDETTLELVVENRGPHLVVLSELWRGAKAVGLWHHIPVPFIGPIEMPPGERVGTTASWQERLPLRIRELRFLLRAGEADGPARFEIPFALRRSPEPRIVPLDRPPLLLRVPQRVARAVLTAPLVLVAVLLLVHQLRAAGVVLAAYGVAYGAAICVWLTRGRREWRGLVVPVVATVAVGVWLVWTGGSFGR